MAPNNRLQPTAYEPPRLKQSVRRYRSGRVNVDVRC